jgi:hypothetical protein
MLDQGATWIVPGTIRSLVGLRHFLPLTASPNPTRFVAFSVFVLFRLFG